MQRSEQRRIKTERAAMAMPHQTLRWQWNGIWTVPHVRKSCEGDGHASPSMSAASHSKSSGSTSPGASNGSAAGDAGPLGSQNQHPGSADPKQGEGSTSPSSAAHNADASGKSGSGEIPICLVGSLTQPSRDHVQQCGSDILCA